MDPSELVFAAVGSLMGGVPAAVVAYRQGRAAEAKAHDVAVERRLDELQDEIDDIRAVRRERRGRR